VAVLLIDVDDLKVINDRLGHGGGDDVLIAVAKCLRGAVRQTDTPARLGGDEFAVLLEDVAGPNEPVQLAQRILAACTAPGPVGEQFAVQVSIGIGLGGGDGVGADELLRRADLAMYAAKHAGGGRLELFDPALEADMTAGDQRNRPSWLRRSDEQADEVRSLLARPDSLAIVFQPIMDLRTGAIVAYEALARFNSAVQRAPDAWFAQAHRCGLGYELEARAVAAALAVPGLPPGARLSINLSPSALASEAVAAILPDDLSGTMIEITEHELVAGNEEVQAAIARVRRAGAWLAVDDAGAGYAGLEHVMRLAPDVIKLDRSIVDGVAHDPVKGAMIGSFVRYARDIDATVCAEGIETLADLDRLAALDVALGQGYGLARPAPPWAPVARDAAQRCVDALTAALARPALDDGDHPLDAAAAQLAALATRDGLARVLETVQRELRCEHIVVHERYAGDPAHDAAASSPTEDLVRHVLCDGQTRQAVMNAGGNGTAALQALGLACMLAVPITCEDRLVGVLEIGRVSLRPWSRFELRQARLIAHQLGSTLERVGHSRAAA
jgi:diguanylate cyclase (GGDEF)-like protein